MKKIEFGKIVGNINERYIQESLASKAKKKLPWMKWAIIAACLCLLLTAFPVIKYFMQSQYNNNQDLRDSLGESETFILNGFQYYVINSPLDSPEYYGFPTEITSKLAAEQVTFFTRDVNGTLTATDKETNIALFEYVKGACDAAKIIHCDDKWYRNLSHL